MEYIINKMKSLWHTVPDNNLTGYILIDNSKQGKSLVLVKDGDHLWKTKWIDTNMTKITNPSQSINSIFKGE